MLKYLTAITMLLCCGWSTASEPAPRAVYLLLHNGQTIHGVVHLQLDRYLVTMSSGVELRLPTDSIAFLGNSIGEVYSFQRAGLNPRDATASLRLADWCLRHHLLDQAALHIKQASTLRRDDPRIAQLQRRHAIQHNRPIPDLSRKARTAQTVFNREQVSERIDQLSAETIQQFTVLIQPLMLNRCGTNQCHGPTADSSLTLLRTAAGRSIPQRLTYRNLFNVLQYLDNKDPLQSSLLLAPSASHGKIDGGIFTDQEKTHLQNLVKWCQLAIQTSNTITPPSVSQPAPILAQPGVPVGPAEEVAEPPGDPAVPPAQSLPVSKDPFDPGPFNRLLHPRQFPAAGPAPKG